MTEKLGGSEQTLCWKCENTNRFKCSWFNPKDPQPVPGWVAERSVNFYGTESYLVRECPNFKPMEARRVRDDDPEAKSGTPGVYYQVNNWAAYAYCDGKSVYLGRFETEQEAVAAREAFFKQRESEWPVDDTCEVIIDDTREEITENAREEIIERLQAKAAKCRQPEYTALLREAADLLVQDGLELIELRYQLDRANAVLHALHR